MSKFTLTVPEWIDGGQPLTASYILAPKSLDSRSGYTISSSIYSGMSHTISFTAPDNEKLKALMLYSGVVCGVLDDVVIDATRQIGNKNQTKTSPDTLAPSINDYYIDIREIKIKPLSSKRIANKPKVRGYLRVVNSVNSTNDTIDVDSLSIPISDNHTYDLTITVRLANGKFINVGLLSSEVNSNILTSEHDFTIPDEILNAYKDEYVNMNSVNNSGVYKLIGKHVSGLMSNGIVFNKNELMDSVIVGVRFFPEHYIRRRSKEFGVEVE